MIADLASAGHRDASDHEDPPPTPRLGTFFISTLVLSFSDMHLKGGVIAIGPEYIDRMIKAVANYDANVRDVKAALNTVFVHAVGTVRQPHALYLQLALMHMHLPSRVLHPTSRCSTMGRNRQRASSRKFSRSPHSRPTSRRGPSVISSRRSSCRRPTGTRPANTTICTQAHSSSWHPHSSAFEHIPLNSFPQDIAQAFADEAEVRFIRILLSLR